MIDYVEIYFKRQLNRASISSRPNKESLDIWLKYHNGARYCELAKEHNKSPVRIAQICKSNESKFKAMVAHLGLQHMIKSILGEIEKIMLEV